MRDALDLVTNGLISSMEYNTSTMVASKHYGRSVVLNHCSENAIADYKAQLENSKYNDPGVFGALPPSTHAIFWHEKHLRGSVHVLSGDIQPQVRANSGAKSKKKLPRKTSSVPRALAAALGRQSRGGLISRQSALS